MRSAFAWLSLLVILCSNAAARSPGCVVSTLTVDPHDHQVWAAHPEGVLLVGNTARLIPLPDSEPFARKVFAFDAACRYFLHREKLYVSYRHEDGTGLPRFIPLMTDVRHLGQNKQRAFAVSRSVGLVTFVSGQPVPWPWAPRFAGNDVDALGVGDRGIALRTRWRLSWYDFQVRDWRHFHLRNDVWTSSSLLQPERQIAVTDRHLILVGTTNIDRLELDTGQWESFDLSIPDHGTVRTLTQSSVGLLFSNGYDLERESANGWLAENLGSCPYAIEEAGSHIWIGTYGNQKSALWRLNPRTGLYRKFDPSSATSSNSVYTLAATAHRLYVGTSCGLAWLDPAVGEIHPVPVEAK